MSGNGDTQARLSAAGSDRRKVGAARLSVLSNTLLVLLKLAVGIQIGSIAVISEAIHSVTDLLAAVIAFFAVRASDLPPDSEHPYGHGKLESVSGLVEALLIAGAGVYILVESGRMLLHPQPAHPPGWGIAVMALSAVVNLFVTRHLFAVARQTDSLALRADARHLSLDVVTSVGVGVGLGLVALTGIRWFDPLVAGVVGLFVLKTAADIAREAAAPLVDHRLPEDEIRLVEEILRADPRILGWHKLRTRQSGSQRHIDVHIQVDDDMSLREAHRVTEELEDRLRAALPNAVVMIHTEPYEEECRHHAEVPH